VLVDVVGEPGDEPGELAALGGRPVGQQRGEPLVAGEQEPLEGLAAFGSEPQQGSARVDAVPRAADEAEPFKLLGLAGDGRRVDAQPRRHAADEVPVALTLRAGRLTPGPGGAAAQRTRLSELRPRSRLRACGADWVAVDHRLSLAGIVRQCRRRHLKVMVWTVNNDLELRYWLSRPRIDILVTDRPDRAIALRGPARPVRSS
jgi:hypothetical protein